MKELKALLIDKHPFILFAAMLLPLLVFRRPVAHGAARILASKKARTFCFAGAIGVIGLFATSAITYLFTWDYSYHIEPHFAALSYLVYKGVPLYHELDSPERYSMLYGPFSYLANGLVMRVFTASMLTSKLGGVAACLGALGILFLAFRKYTPRSAAFVLIGLICLVQIQFGTWTFYVRGDPWVLLCVAAGLFLIHSPRQWLPAALMSGVAAGISTNTKIHSCLFFVPILVGLVDARGAKAILPFSLAALTSFFAPYLAFGNISFTNYVDWIRAATKHGVDSSVLGENLQFLPFALWPLVGAAASWPGLAAGQRRKISLAVSVLAVSVLLYLVPASKHGAGAWHLLPFLYLSTYLSLTFLHKVEMPGRIRSLRGLGPAQTAIVIAACLALVVIGAFKFRSVGYYVFFDSLTRKRIHAEVIAFADQYSTKRIMMGYARSKQLYHDDKDPYLLSCYYPLLVFRGHPLLLDMPAISDMEQSGFSIPESTTDKIVSFEDAVWLIPKGLTPFLFRYGQGEMQQERFSDRLRSEFAGNYLKIDSGEFFDVWAHR